MENKIKTLITELMEENSKRAERMNESTISQYEHTVLVHTYNNTLDILKRLENLISK